MRSLDEFPRDIRALLERVEPISPESWANTTIPALGGRSVFELLDQEGPEAVRLFALKVIGKFS